MKKLTSTSITGIGVGLFFLLFGAMKLFMMGPGSGVADMIGGLFGTSDSLSVIIAWFLTLVEFIGGIIIVLYFICKKLLSFLGDNITNILVYLSLLSFLAVDIVGFITAHWMKAGFEPKQFLWHLMLAIVIIGLMLAPSEKKQ